MLWVPRPRVEDFLTRISKVADLYIYTKGKREYALNVLSFLKNVKFEKIVTGEECPGSEKKSLEHVFGHNLANIKDRILIFDDNSAVWRDAD